MIRAGPRRGLTDADDADGVDDTTRMYFDAVRGSFTNYIIAACLGVKRACREADAIHGNHGSITSTAARW